MGSEASIHGLTKVVVRSMAIVLLLPSPVNGSTETHIADGQEAVTTDRKQQQSRDEDSTEADIGEGQETITTDRKQSEQSRDDGSTETDIADGQETFITDTKQQQSRNEGSTETHIPDGQKAVTTDRQQQQSRDEDSTEADIAEGQETITTDRKQSEQSRDDGSTETDIADGQETFITDTKQQQSRDEGSTETHIADGQEAVTTDRKQQQSRDEDSTETDITEGQEAIATDRKQTEQSRDDGSTETDIADGQEAFITDRKKKQSRDEGSTETDINDGEAVTTARKQQQSRDEETDEEIPDGQQTLVTDRKPQQLTDADKNRKTRAELTIEATHPGDVEIAEEKCQTLLLTACETGQLFFVKSFLTKGGVDCRDKWRRTPVMYAARWGQGETFHYLLSQGCDLSHVDYANNNVFHIACKGGNADIVKYLIATEKFDIESRNRRDKTPILIAAYYGHRELFQLLQMKGCNLTAVDVSKYNVLHAACASGSVDLVQYILSLNIFSIDVKGYNGRTPVMTAAMQGTTGVVQFLVNRGCNLTAVDDKENNVFHLTCDSATHVDTVKYLMTLRDCKGMEKAKNIVGETPAQIAEKNGCKNLTRLLKGIK